MDHWYRRAALIALLAGSSFSLACGSGHDEDSGSGGVSEGPRFPCEIEDVIQAKCQRCHGEPQANGAPFPLLTWEDTQRQYGVELTYEAMFPAIESGFMPLTQLPLDPPVEPLTPQERTLLLDWLADGAKPAFDVTCDSAGF